MPAPVSIVEMQSFLRDTEGVLTDAEKNELIDHLSANPGAGVVIPGTGGVRKLRWAASGRGKRGGGRAIYYFHDEDMPLFLISFFTKSVKTDLSQSEKQAARALVDQLVEQYHPRR